MVLAETTGQGSLYHLHGLGLVAQFDSTTTDYLAYDGLGSVRRSSPRPSIPYGNTECLPC